MGHRISAGCFSYCHIATLAGRSRNTGAQYAHLRRMQRRSALVIPANEGLRNVPDTPTLFRPEHSGTLALNSGCQSQRNEVPARASQPFVYLPCIQALTARSGHHAAVELRANVPVCSLTHTRGSSPLVFIAPRLSPCGTQGKISPIGCRKLARSRCLWVPSKLGALADECGSTFTVPRFLGGRGAKHTPHFAPGVNCTDRHEERQAPVGYHKCETESKFLFVGSGWGFTRLRYPICRRVFGCVRLRTNTLYGDRVVDCFCGLQCSSERLCVQGSSKPFWRTISGSQATSRRSVHSRRAWGFWTASDQCESSWTAQGMILCLSGPCSKCYVLDRHGRWGRGASGNQPRLLVGKPRWLPLRYHTHIAHIPSISRPRPPGPSIGRRKTAISLV